MGACATLLMWSDIGRFKPNGKNCLKSTKDTNQDSRSMCHCFLKPAQPESSSTPMVYVGRVGKETVGKNPFHLRITYEYYYPLPAQRHSQRRRLAHLSKQVGDVCIRRLWLDLSPVLTGRAT
jgi:hypothetical protein